MVDSSSHLDMAFVHENFPGLKADWVFLDNAGGSQTVRGAIDRITEFLVERNVQIGGSYAVSQAAADALMQGREAAQLLVNAERPEEIVFGHSTTVLLQNLAAAMRGELRPGDEIVVSVADHESNIGPWERLREFGVKVKTWNLDSASMTPRTEDLESLMTERTKLVCVHHVSNILGWVNPIKEIAEFVHARGARICVDGVAYSPHRAMDVRAWDVDFYVFSMYKCYGPHIAVMYGKYDVLRELDGLYHYFYGKEKVPGKLEPGNPNYELAYSIAGVVEYLIGLGARQGCIGSDRQKLEAAFESITVQENALTERLLSWLRARNDCRIVGSDRNERGARVPTISFKFDNLDSKNVVAAMDDYGLAIRFGDFHARRLVESLQEDGRNGVIRVSMVHYNTIEEVDRLIAALGEIVAKNTTAA